MTAEKALEVKAKKKQYPTITQDDLAAMCGLNVSTVRKVLHGDYDGLIDGGTAPEAVDLSGIEMAVSLLAEVVDDLRRVTVMNNELLRVCALGVTNANDPGFSNSKNVAANFRQNIIDNTWIKNRGGNA